MVERKKEKQPLCAFLLAFYGLQISFRYVLQDIGIQGTYLLKQAIATKVARVCRYIT